MCARAGIPVQYTPQSMRAKKPAVITALLSLTSNLRAKKILNISMVDKTLFGGGRLRLKYNGWLSTTCSTNVWQVHLTSSYVF